MCQGVCRVLSGRRGGGEDRWATGERSALPLFHIPGRRGEHTPRGTPSRWRLSAEIINLHTWQRAVFFPGPTMSMSARRGCDASQPRAAAPSQPVFSFSAPRAGGARNGFVDTVDQLQVFSLHFSPPPPFLLFFPSRGRPSDGRAITLGSRIFSAEQSLSRFSPHGERVWTGKSTVCGGLSRTPHPGSSLSNQSRKTVGKCRTSLPNYARSRVSLAEHSLQEWAGNVVERGFSFFLFAKVSQRAPPVFCGEKRDNYRCFPAPSSLYCPASFGTVSACTRRPATFLFPSFLLSLLGIKP